MEQLADSRENWLFGQDSVRRPKRLAADRCHGRPDFHKPPQESAGWLLASRCSVVLRWGGAGSDLDEKMCCLFNSYRGAVFLFTSASEFRNGRIQIYISATAVPSQSLRLSAAWTLVLPQRLLSCWHVIIGGFHRGHIAVARQSEHREYLRCCKI